MLPTYSHLNTSSNDMEPKSDPCTANSNCTCCDERCVKAIATNECRAAGDAHLRGSSASSCADICLSKKLDLDAHSDADNSSNTATACSDHLRRAFDRYASYLSQARCICETVIANAQSLRCCEGRGQQIDENVALSTAVPALRANVSGVRVRTSGKKCCEAQSKSCPRFNSDHNITPTAVASASSSSDAARQVDPPEEKSAQAEKQRFCSKSMLKEIYRLESDEATEHITARIAGMDCSTCALKVARALQSARGISNIHVTFITGTAEFDINPKLTSAEAAIEHVEDATGYTLSRFTPDVSVLDVFIDTTQQATFQDSLSHGVLECQRLSRRVVQVRYDPCLIGARDVLRSTNSSLAPLRDLDLAIGRAKLYRTLLLTFMAALFTIPVVILAWANTQAPVTTRLTTQLILASVVQASAYPEFYRPAVLSLVKDRVIEMDMLVVISITAAYCYSVVAYAFAIAGSPLEIESFFETSTLLITLVLLGRVVTSYARKAAIAAVSSRSLQPQQAILGTETIDARLLHYGDQITVPAHSQIVTDAIVLEGTSEVDEAMLTGESLPVIKTVGDSLTAGTLNGQGALVAKVVRLTGKNTISDITGLVEDAQKSQPRIQELADKIASYFVPAVVVIAILVVVIWTVIGVKRGDGSSTAGLAISYGIAVLAVSCPCALGLAVPMVLVVAGGVASRAGVIIKAADATERGHKVTDVIFDKTGTLTEDAMTVTDQVIIQHTSETPSIVKCLVKDNAHPISRAIDATLGCEANAAVENIISIPGAGLTGTWRGSIIQAGSPHWMSIEKEPLVLSLLSRNLSIFCVTLDSQLIAIYGLQAKMRGEAGRVVQALQHRGIQVHIVSGDNRNAVVAAAEVLNVPIGNVVARASPESKRDYIRELNEAGKMTLFCGDGTNDAVAVAQARVGVHIGSSDMTRAVADVVLLGGLGGVITLLDISRAAYHRITFNFIWSAIYNVLAISLAAGAFVKVRIPPAYAGLGEIVSVLPVMIIGLTMLWQRH